MQDGVRVAFDTYEQQLDALRESVGVIVPRMTAGRRAFFDDFLGWTSQYTDKVDPNAPFVILPDPSLCLAFPYPRDEIRTALSAVSSSQPTEELIERSIVKYGLSPELLSRPVVALSGGERLLLCFAKADIYSQVSPKLIMCSPTHWLNGSKYPHIEDVVSQYKNRNKQVELFLLHGEPLLTSLPERDGVEPVADRLALRWSLGLKSFDMTFPEINFPQKTASKTLRYIADGSEIKLVSPTLLSGDNGVGKSVFARVLAGIFNPTEKPPTVNCGGSVGKARLLFQDSVDQLFGQSIDGHIDEVFRFDQERKKLALSIYEAIEKRLREFILANDWISQGALGNRERHDSILQSKIALAAERLASKPPLLIVDEPGWCLSKPLARVFMEALCTQAKEQHVAVLIISHLEGWWSGIVNSMITMTRSPGSSTDIRVSVVSD